MKRKFYEELAKWKKEKLHIPLMVVGARQVGKTYIIDQFCQENFDNYYYLNFMKEKEFVNLFDSIDSFEKKVEVLETLVGGSLRNNDKTVLFVDEVQQCESFIEALKFFNESNDTFNIICAGSLLGVALRRLNYSFPVGKVVIKYMYPLDFEEFLWATGNEKYIKEIKYSFNNNVVLPDIYHNYLIDQFYKFLYLGGMPNVVNNFITNEQNMALIDTDIIKNIVEAYFDDMSKYANNLKASRIRNIYSSIPSQLAKENQKFLFSQVDEKDNRKRDYISPLDWLIASKLVFLDYLVTKPEFPLKGFLDKESFKIYLSDTGILNSLLGISQKAYILDKDFSFKGIITENYVANELVKMGYDLFYWSRKGKNNGNAEIDFIIQKDNDIIPIEVKAGKNTQAKSLKVYMETFKPKYAIKLSSNNFSFNENIKDIPLYALFCLKD